MGNPVISVVTVSFNAASCIEKTIRSVLSQTCTGFEYIIIDGGSTDGTQDIVRKYSDRIAYFVSEPDGGIYDGMNKGMRAASGLYVIYMNADDVFADESVLSDVVSFALSHPEAEVIYGDSVQVREYGSYLSVPREAAIGHKMAISHQASFVSRELMLTHPFDLRYRYAADFEQLSYFHGQGRTFVHMDRVIAVVEMRSGTTFRHELESAQEMYSIISSRGIDISKERDRILRHKRMVRCFKRWTPGFVSRPLLRMVAKFYKPL